MIFDQNKNMSYWWDWTKFILTTMLTLVFLPLIIPMMCYFAWVLKIHSEIPEDLDEQVRLANEWAKRTTNNIEGT